MVSPYLTHWLISTRGPTKRVAVPKSVGDVKHVGEDVKAAVRMHREALCGNHISGAPRHRREQPNSLVDFHTALDLHINIR